MAPIALRSLTLTKEEAAVARVALAAVGERTDVLSAEGREVLRHLIVKADALITSFPPDVLPDRIASGRPPHDPETCAACANDPEQCHADLNCEHRALGSGFCFTHTVGL